MYTYIKSLVLERSLGAQWTEAQLPTTSVYNIYNMFSKVAHIVTHPLFEKELYVDFEALRNTYSGYNGTLLEWLAEIGDLTLPLLETLPNTQVKYAWYEDAVRCGYKAELGQVGYHFPADYPKIELPDLKITRPRTTTDVSVLHTKALMTVNGFLHLTDTDGQSLWIKDGAKSMHHCKLNHFGIISFNQMATIKKIPITPAMLYPEVTDRPLIENVNIRLPEEIGNRSFLLSIGGYLQLPEAEICWQNGDQVISLCLEKIPYAERYFESSHYLDLSALQLEPSPDHPNAITIDQLSSDEVIRRYLTLSQSFIVLIDIPYIFSRKIFIRHSALPGNYTAYQEPRYPQITGYGKISEYWKVYEDGHWVVNVVDGYTDNYVFTYRPLDRLQVITDQRVPGRTYQHSGGFLLE